MLGRIRRIRRIRRGRRGSFNLNSLLLLVPTVLVLLVFFYVLYIGLLKDDSPFISSEAQASDVFNISYDIASLILPLSSSSFSEIKALDKLSFAIDKRISHYKPVVERLSNDYDIKSLGISPLSMYLYFIGYNTSDKHPAMRILLEKPFGNILASLINKEQGYKKKHRKKRRNIYAGFLTKQALKEGRIFMKKKKTLLNRMARRYKVSKEFLVAILFVETRFGKITGTNLVFNVYNALYHYNSDNLLSKNLISHGFVDSKEDIETDNEFPLFSSKISSIFFGKAKRPAPEKPSVVFGESNLGNNDANIVSNNTFHTLASYVRKKKEWGYEQIKSLFGMAFSYGIDIRSLKGSWAGAFGYCQFIPSSYISLARDGNNDGVIDLFVFDDAIASIGSYLKDKGFVNKNKKKIRGAIYKYNLSTDYVNAIYNYAKLLKKRFSKKKRLKRRLRRKSRKLQKKTVLAKRRLQKAKREWARLGTRKSKRY